MDIVLFTNSVRCYNCSCFDLTNGLKKIDNKWICGKCRKPTPDNTNVKEKEDENRSLYHQGSQKVGQGSH